jgi:hypothetical protein
MLASAVARAVILAEYTWYDGATTFGAPVSDVSGNGHDGVVYYGAVADGGTLTLGEDPDQPGNYHGAAWFHWDENIMDGKDYVYMRFEDVVSDKLGWQGSALASEYSTGRGYSWNLSMVSSGTRLNFDVVDSNGAAHYVNLPMIADEPVLVECFYDGDGGAGGVSQIGLRLNEGSWATFDGTASGVFGTTDAALLIGAFCEHAGVGGKAGTGWHGTVGRVVFADSPYPFPEPGALCLAGMAVAGAVLRRRR